MLNDKYIYYIDDIIKAIPTSIKIYILESKDLSTLRFKLSLLDYSKKLYNEYIKTKDIDADIENVLLKTLMVDKWNKEHTYRLVQTTSIIYKAYATNYVLLIGYLLYSNKIDKSKFDKYINDLVKVNEINLEYEKQFPCVTYVKKSTKRVSNKKDKVLKEKVTKERIPKESKAEAKLKRQALLFSNVTINIKKK